MNKSKIKKGTALILEGLIGPEWKEDENYKDTPRRVADAYEEIFAPRGYEAATFPATYKQMLVLSHHKEWAMCPHHLMPFKMDISVAYIPCDEKPARVLGLSKLVRLIQNHFEEPILQEDLTDSIADEVIRVLSKDQRVPIEPGRSRLVISKPMGVGVLIEGEHSCMQARGVKTDGYVITSAMRGVFLTKPEVREEFLTLIRR